MYRPWINEPQSGGNGADSAGVWAFILFIGYFVLMGRMLYPSLSKIQWLKDRSPQVVEAASMSDLPDSFQQPGYMGVSVAAAAAAPTAMIEPTVTIEAAPTIEPTATIEAAPTAQAWGTATPGADRFTALYSYYDPALGGVNCHFDNWRDGACHAVLLGQPWQHWINTGVAVAPSLFEQFPFGTKLIVTSPPEIAGRWYVVDICPGCEASLWDDGQYRFDFLMQQQVLSWATPFEFYIEP